MQVSSLVALGHNDARATNKWMDELPNRRVKPKWSAQQEALLLREPEGVPHPVDMVGECAVRDFDSLGCTGRAGSENDVGELLRRGSYCGCVFVLFRAPCKPRIDVEILSANGQLFASLRPHQETLPNRV